MHNLRYHLSKLVPVPMRSTYGVEGNSRRQRSTWIQWRGRIFRHRIAPLG